MIITRSPLRITFGGGGTDILPYSQRFEGFCISAAISKYNYICVHHPFSEGIVLKYSHTEKVKYPKDIKHPIFREALKDINLKTPQIEIVSMADVPSDGAGLGNSGAFTVGLIKALYSYRNISIPQEKIAEKACDINMNILKRAQGKQDEYISSFGGIICLEFKKDGSVNHYPLDISHQTLIDLEENLILLYTGVKHDTQSILAYQEREINKLDKEMIYNLDQVKESGEQAKVALEKGDTLEFAQIINEQWELKEKRMTNKNYLLHSLRRGLLENGALGVKLVGSGMGGFFLAYTKDKDLVRQYANRKIEELRFGFDFEGCRRII